TVNLSVLDGWWAEAYDGSNGWAIPPSPRDYDAAERDQHDARTLYEILQDQVASLYYDRDERLGYSPEWVQLCKRSMASILPHFNMQRVVHDYAGLYYGPAARAGRELSAGGFSAARALADWKARVRERWAGVKIAPIRSLPPQSSFNDTLELE